MCHGGDLVLDMQIMRFIFDITEEIDCIIDKAGSVVNLEIHGFY